MAIVALLGTVITFLNSFSGLIGGVWLLWLGDWELVLYGFFAAVASPFWTGVLLLPGILLVFPAAGLSEKGYLLPSVILGILGLLYTYVAISVWCFAVFWYVLQFIGNNDPTLPFLLYAYSIATAPWLFLMKKEVNSGGSDSSIISTFAACVGCLFMLLYISFASMPTFLTVVWLFSIPMVIAFLLSVFSLIINFRGINGSHF